MEDRKEIEKKLRKRLKPERYEHTMGVMYTAASLAMRYDTDVEQAMYAGLLHDCGKYCSTSEQIHLCEKYGIHLSESELEMPALIHAKLGVYLAEHQYDVSSKEILQAIRYHTTGRKAMTLLEKIVYIADYIEPGRKMIPILPEVRLAAFQNIDEAVYLSAGATISFLKGTSRPIDTLTIETYEYYKNQIGEKEPYGSGKKNGTACIQST